MDLDMLGKFIQKYLLAVIMSVLTFLFLRDYLILFIPFLIIAILLEGSAPSLFLGFLIGVGIDLYSDGTSQQQTQMLIITGGIAFISIAIQFVQRYIIKVERTSTTTRNATFAMVGLALMYMIMYSRCTNYSLPPDFAYSIPEEYVGMQVFLKVGICTADYAIGPLIGLSDLSPSLDLLSILVRACGRILLFLPFIWSAVFAAFSELLYIKFKFNRLIVLSFFGFLGQLTAGALISFILSPIFGLVYFATITISVYESSYAPTLTSAAIIIYIALGALTYAMGSGYGVNLGARKFYYDQELEDRINRDPDRIPAEQTKPKRSINILGCIVLGVIGTIVFWFLCIVAMGGLNIVLSLLYQSGYFGE